MRLRIAEGALRPASRLAGFVATLVRSQRRGPRGRIITPWSGYRSGRGGASTRGADACSFALQSTDAHGAMNHRERSDPRNGQDAVRQVKPFGARVQDASRWALCGVLALSAISKLLTPYQNSYVVPEPLYYLGSLIELGAAVLLHTRYRNSAIAASVALAIGGIALATALPGRLCGCFGSLVQLDGPSHVLLSAIVGTLACLCFGPDASRAVGSSAITPGDP